MIFNKKFEQMTHREMSELQSHRLKALVEKLFEKVPFYKRKIELSGSKPFHIGSILDINRLPFTTKDELRETYPYGLLAADFSEIVEIHTSSGTTGKPVVDAYTINDIDLWGEVMARCLSMGDVTEKDTIQNAYGYGLFTGGLGVHYGARKIGANVIPISGGNSQRQLMIMSDFKSTVLTCTPSYVLYLAEIAKESGVDISKLSLRCGFFGAEPWSENMRRQIEKSFPIKAYDIYGLTEVIGPGVANECEYCDGLHFHEDHFYPEIINPKTGEVLADGEKGELVITTLTKEGTPLLRYRTRDITYLMRGRCKCGRTTVRMHRLLEERMIC